MLKPSQFPIRGGCAKALGQQGNDEQFSVVGAEAVSGRTGGDGEGALKKEVGREQFMSIWIYSEVNKEVLMV